MTVPGTGLGVEDAVGDADVGPALVTDFLVVAVDPWIGPWDSVGTGVAVVGRVEVMPVPFAGSAVDALSSSDLEIADKK